MVSAPISFPDLPTLASPIDPAFDAIRRTIARTIDRHEDAGMPAVLAEVAAVIERERLAIDVPLTLRPATDMRDALLANVAARHAHREATGRDVMGYATGFPRLDTAISGLERGRLGILLAGPGTGKTNLSNQLAAHVARQSGPVLFVTLENSAADLYGKQLARLARVSATDVQRGKIAPHVLARAAETFTEQGGEYLHYVEGSAQLTLDTIRQAVATLRQRFPDGSHPLVIVDYLQPLARMVRVVGSGAGVDDMRGKVGAAMQGLRDLVAMTGAHCWVISSLSRAGGGGNGDYSKPSLAGARESGEIEFGADYVLALARDDDAPASTVDRLTLTILKNRHGGDTGTTIRLGRDRATLALHEIDAAAPPAPLASRLGA